jgi:hypothetical protein
MPVSLKRRTVLKLGSGVAVVAAGGTLLHRALKPGYTPLSDHARDTVVSVIDLLIPGDEHAPSALDLAIHEEILPVLDVRTSLRHLTREAITWLDSQAIAGGDKDFISASREIRETILVRAEQSQADSVAAKFFAQMRTMSFEYYYSRAETWTSLCYPGPPQPKGFMDYAEPPGGCDFS